jgi:hypothetical protein
VQEQTLLDSDVLEVASLQHVARRAEERAEAEGRNASWQCLISDERGRRVGLLQRGRAARRGASAGIHLVLPVRPRARPVVDGA